MRWCRRGGVVFGRRSGCGSESRRGCRREYAPRRRRTDNWLLLVGVLVDHRDPKLRPFVYVVVFPARVKTNANNSVPRRLAIVDDYMGHGCRRTATRVECPGDQFVHVFSVAAGRRGRLTVVEDVNSSPDDGRGSHIVGRGCRNGSVDAHGDRQARALPYGTGRRDALQRNHRAGGVALLRDAAVFLGECFAGLRHIGKRGEEGKCEQRNSYRCRGAAGTVV